MGRALSAAVFTAPTWTEAFGSDYVDRTMSYVDIENRVYFTITQAEAHGLFQRVKLLNTIKRHGYLFRIST